MKKGRQKRILQLESLETREMLSLEGLASVSTLWSDADLVSTAVYQATARAESPQDANSAAAANSYGPSAEEQEMLELINRMRTDPQGELHRLIKSFSPYDAWDSRITTAIRTYSYPKPDVLAREWASLVAAPPLAWNSSLAIAAADHSYAMMVSGEQSHQLEGEPPLYDRVVNAGYEPNYDQDENGEYVAIVSENVYAHGLAASGRFSNASFTHAAFAIDWNVPNHDHRDNIMNPLFTEVGVSMLASTNPSVDVGPWITTVDFGASPNAQSGDGAYLLGVLFDDLNASGYYEAGEGLGNVNITVTSQGGTGESYEFSSYSAGGYQHYLENGFYSITVSGGAFAQPITKYAFVQGENVKVDFTLQELSSEAPVLDLNGPILDGIHYNVTFFESGDPVMLLASNANLSDADGETLSTMKITLQNRPDGPNEYLLIDTAHTSLQSNYDSSTGELLIYGSASLEDYLSVLKSLQYGNAARKADLGDRLVTIAVSDGIQWSETAETKIAFVQQTFETLTVADVQIAEGDDQHELVFHFELSDVPRCNVLVEYEFLDGTAFAGTHYIASSGTLMIDADRRSASVSVQILGDFLPGEDLNFSLNIKSVTGASCETLIVDAEILDDDTPLNLGQITRWHVDDVDLSDGFRRLYSFTPSRQGQVMWEATLPEGVSAGDVEMVLFRDSHAEIPLAYSLTQDGKIRLESDIFQGQNYVLLVKGDVPLEKLRMVQILLVRDEFDNGLDFHLDPDGDEELLIDLLEGKIEYDGVEIFADLWDEFEYSRIGFENVSPNHVVTIIGGGSGSSGSVIIDPEKPTIPEEFPPIDLDPFTYVEYLITDPSQTVVLQGTSGNDVFEFLDGVATFRTSAKKIITVRGGKIFEVNGNGGDDRALIYDTVYSDHVTMATDQVQFLGGGDSGYLLDVYDFNTVDLSSYYGGGDTVLMQGAGSAAYLDDWQVQRVEKLGDSGAVRRYSATGFYETVIDQTLKNGFSPVYITGSDKQDFLYVTPGNIQANDSRDSYRFSVIGASEVYWSTPSQHASLPTILVEQPDDWSVPIRECNGDVRYYSAPGAEKDAVGSLLIFEANKALDYYLNNEKSTTPDRVFKSFPIEGTDTEAFGFADEIATPVYVTQNAGMAIFVTESMDSPHETSISHRLFSTEQELLYQLASEAGNLSSGSAFDFSSETELPENAWFDYDTEAETPDFTHASPLQPVDLALLNELWD